MLKKVNKLREIKMSIVVRTAVEPGDAGDAASHLVPLTYASTLLRRLVKTHSTPYFIGVSCVSLSSTSTLNFNFVSTPPLTSEAKK